MIVNIYAPNAKATNFYEAIVIIFNERGRIKYNNSGDINIPLSVDRSSTYKIEKDMTELKSTND
jgi:hypothetical protein